MIGGDTRASYIANITKINAIITSLYTTALTSVGNGDIVKYEIDTGQTKQNVEYRDLESITAAIAGYEKLKNLYKSYLTPSAVRLVDSKNLRNRT